jgi:DNA-binding NarL/FixJ family response regulator
MPIRILLVDDFEPWRRMVWSILQEEPELRIICEVSDGLAAIQSANELKPDLILLDLGLPKPDGIDAARKIRKLAPKAKILFLSQESSPDVVRRALRFGAGFVVKTDAGKELLSAIEAVNLNKQYLSSKAAGHTFRETIGAPILTELE